MAHLKLIVGVLLSAVLVYSGVYFTKEHYEKVVLGYEDKIRQIELDAKTAQVEELSRVLNKNLELAAKNNQLDREWSEKYEDSLQANADLGDKYRTLRLRLSGTSCPTQGPLSTDPGAISADADLSVALSEETRLAVFDLRESIIKDKLMIEKWQEWWNQVGSKVNEKAPN